MGGEVFGITSEPQSLAEEAEEAWDLSFPIVGDPHHEIREQLHSRGGSMFSLTLMMDT